MNKSTVFVVLVLSLVLFSGCADKVKISGTVTFEDGEPVTRGQVTFRADDGSTYYGYLDKNGKYSPGETRDGQPIPSGKYIVWLTATDISVETLAVPGDQTTATYSSIQTVDSKYTSPDTTEMTFEVKRGGPKIFDFTVEKYVDPKAR